MSTGSPTLDNPDINIVCDLCDKKLMWEAERNNGSGKVQLVVSCECGGTYRRAIIPVDVKVDQKVFLYDPKDDAEKSYLVAQMARRWR